MRILLVLNLLYILLLLQSCGVEKIDPGPPEEIIVDPGYTTQFFVTDLKFAVSCEDVNAFEYVKGNPVNLDQLPQYAQKALSLKFFIQDNNLEFVAVGGLKYLLRATLDWDIGEIVTLTLDDYPSVKIIFTRPSTSSQKPKIAVIENAHLLFDVDSDRSKKLSEDQLLFLANNLPGEIEIEYSRVVVRGYSYDYFPFINGCHKWRSKDF